MKRFVIVYLTLLVLTLAVPALVCLINKAPEESDSLVNIFQGIMMFRDSREVLRYFCLSLLHFS